VHRSHADACSQAVGYPNAIVDHFKMKRIGSKLQADGAMLRFGMPHDVYKGF
jgi:hypothetical protein